MHITISLFAKQGRKYGNICLPVMILATIENTNGQIDRSTESRCNQLSNIGHHRRLVEGNGTTKRQI